MNWDAISAIGEAIGAAAVLGSLIYLAIQIRGNSLSTRTATEVEAGKASTDWTLRWANDKELPEIWDKVARGDALDMTETRRYLWMVAAYCTLAQTVFDQYEQGMVSERCWENFERTIIGLIQTDFVQTWWLERGGNYNSALYEHINSSAPTYPEWRPPEAAGYVGREGSVVKKARD